MGFVKYSLFLVAVLLATSIYAQKIDSLKTLLSFKDGSERIEILRLLSMEVYEIDPIKSLNYALEGYVSAKERKDSVMLLKAGRRLSWCLRSLGKMDSSSVICNEILFIAQALKDTVNQIYILNAQGINHTYNAEYDQSLISYLHALDLAKKIGDLESIAMLLTNTGLAYYKLKDYSTAKEYFLRTLALKERIKDNDDMPLLLLNIGLCYAYTAEFFKAEHYTNKARQVCDESCPSELLAMINFNNGVISIESGNCVEAEKHFLTSLNYARQARDIRFQLDNLACLIRIYIDQNDLGKATFHLKEAEKWLDNGAQYNLERLKFYMQFVQVYLLKKNYKQAAVYQKKYIQLRDHLYSEDLTTNLMKVESVLQKRENDEKITIQDALLSLKEEAINYQSRISVAIGLVVLALFILVVVLLLSITEQKKINALLDKKVRERKVTLNDECSRLQHFIVFKETEHAEILCGITKAFTAIKDISQSATIIEVEHHYFEKIFQLTDMVEKKLKDSNIKEINGMTARCSKKGFINS